MNVFLNFLLIPHFGIYGAAIASLVTQFFTNVLLGYIIVPIRHNNALMVRSLHPKYLIETIKKVKYMICKRLQPNTIVFNRSLNIKNILTATTRLSVVFERSEVFV